MSAMAQCYFSTVLPSHSEIHFSRHDYLDSRAC